MIKKSNKCSVILFLALFNLSAFSQESKTVDLNKLADDAKYNYAIQFFRLGKHEKALELLNEYLEIYKNGAHRVKAYNTIANIYFDRSNYIRSIKAYEALYQEFNNSQDGIEAYFNTGICYMKMGYDENAKIIFNSIINKYPDSNYAYLSKIRLDLIEIIQ